MLLPGVSTRFLLLLCALAVGAGEQRGNSYVKTSISLSRRIVQPGDSAEILVRFAPIDGIHITARPPVNIDLDAGNILFLSGNVQQPLDAKTGYLASDVPVRRPFRILAHSNPGEYTITGTCTYFFCSDVEGWCTKFSQPIELTLTIAK